MKRTPLKRKTPGPGWRRVWTPTTGWGKSKPHPSVFDHENGVRVHTSGLCTLPGGKLINGMEYPESSNLRRCGEINGWQQETRRHGVGNAGTGGATWQNVKHATR